MAYKTLDYLITASWTGKQATAAAAADMGKMGDSATSAGRGFLAAGKDIVTSLAGIGLAIGGAVMAGKQLYEALGEGAALERSADMFDRLAISIGSTADVMLGRLRDATNGMVSDAQLVAGAGQIISLGLADTEDGVVRLSTLVSKLGWDMQQVIMTFANNSVMRLDALGLSVEDVNAKMKVLEATGMSADKAFDMAVIQAGEEKLRLLGDAAETTAGQMAMLETSWTNFTDNLKIAVAETLGPAVAGLAEHTTNQRKIQSDLNQAYKLGLVSLEEYAHLTTTLGNNAEIAANTLQRVQDRLNVITFGEELERLSAAVHSMDLPAAEVALRGYTNELEQLAIAGRSAMESQQAFDAMLYPDGIDAYNMALAREAKWLEAVAAGYTTAAGAIEALQAARKAEQEAQRQALGSEFADLFNMDELARQFGSFYQFARDNTEKIAELQEKLAADKFDKPIEDMTEKQAEAFKELNDELAALQETQGQLVTAWNVDEVMASSVEIMLNTAAAAGTAKEQLYLLAGGGEAAADAMIQAAINVRAAQLGELLAGGFITAKAAIEDLQNYANTITLEELFRLDRILPDTTSPETLRDRLLGPAEGLVSAVSDTVTAAAQPAGDAIQELIDQLNKADEADPEIDVDDDAVTSATGNVTGLYDSLVNLTSQDWVVNVVYQTSGSIPGAGDGYSGGSGTYSPPPPTNSGGGGGAPGGSGPAGRGPATNNTTNYTTNNYWTNGVTPGTLDNALASYGRRSAGATR